MKSVALDCDGDALLVRVDQVGRGLPHRRPHLFRRRRRSPVIDARAISSRATLDRAGRTHRLVPITRTLFADAETPVGVYRKLAGGPARHVPARVRRAGRVVLALVLRRRRRLAALSVGDGVGGLDRRRARRACRPSGDPLEVLGAAWRAMQGPAPARPAAADRRVRRLPRLRRGAPHRAAARQGGRRARPARADDAAGHRPGRRRPPRVHGRADRQRARATRR